MLHNTCVFVRQVRVNWSDRREERIIWRCTLAYNSAKLYESDCQLGTGCSVRYSWICPPVTDPNAVFHIKNRPFLDPFLSWSTQPTFTHLIAILPFWYLRSGFFHSHIRLQIWLDFSTPLCVREVCLILRPCGEDQIPNSRCVMKITINRLTPNDPYMGRTAPLTSKHCILYIYSTNIDTEYFKHALYIPVFFSSKCSLFHNANLFGSCIIHSLYTGCAKIKKIIPAPKG